MANTCCASNVKLLAVKDTETSNRIYHSSIYCHWEIFSICRHHLLLKVKKSYHLHNAGCSLKNMIYHIYIWNTLYHSSFQYVWCRISARCSRTGFEQSGFYWFIREQIVSSNISDISNSHFTTLRFNVFKTDPPDNYSICWKPYFPH